MFEHKDYVEAIFQEKSFGKAAERIHISQPALSALVKRPCSTGRPIPFLLRPLGLNI